MNIKCRLKRNRVHRANYEGAAVPPLTLTSEVLRTTSRPPSFTQELRGEQNCCV